MRIKLFEGFNTDDYYTKIDERTYNDLRTSIVSMTDKDIQTIIKDLKLPTEWEEDIVGLRAGTYCPPKQQGLKSSDREGYKILVIYPLYGSMTISKLDDDWFIVYILSKQLSWYKCDQLDGLKKFLKDKI